MFTCTCLVYTDGHFVLYYNKDGLLSRDLPALLTMSVDFFCSLWSCVQCDCLICCLFALSVSSGDQVDHLGLCVGVCVIVVVFLS